MFNLADYEPVEVRLEKFIKDHPDFRISTELEVVEASRYIVKAYLFKTSQDSIAWATGYAEETVSTRGVNQTSALENCETSAIGRALANAGYAPKGKRPSREEMKKVAPNHPALQVVPQPVDVDYWNTSFQRASSNRRHCQYANGYAIVRSWRNDMADRNKCKERERMGAHDMPV